MTQTLLHFIRQMLDKTSLDDGGDEKICLIIEHGMATLRGYDPSLTDADFEDASKTARPLLADYCRYAYSNATEMFKVNYAEELLALRIAYQTREAQSGED